MHEKDTYIYPAVFDFADDGIGITFPDLPGCTSCAFSIEEAVHHAREAMGLHLYGMEEDNDPIPEPSDILSIKHKKIKLWFMLMFLCRVSETQSKIKQSQKQ